MLSRCRHPSPKVEKEETRRVLAPFVASFARFAPFRSLAMPRPRETQVIYVHDTGGLGETAVVNFNAGQEVELMRPVSSQSVERSGDVAVRTGSGSLGPFRLGCGSVWGSFLVRFNGVPRAALLDVSDC